MNFILALDQGTTSSRAMVFDHAGTVRAMAQREIRQIFPQPGWVEHEPNEIWDTQLAVAREALAKAKLTARDIDNYATCPRRFFYERVLNLKRRSRASAYLDAHGCIQAVIAYVRDLEENAPYDAVAAQAVFDSAWFKSGLADHPFGAAYQRLVSTMLVRLHTTVGGASVRSGALLTAIGSNAIGALADRIIEVDGALVVRNIRSGKRSIGDPDRLSATILLKAVSETLGSGARVENHYLLGAQTMIEIGQTAAKYTKRLSDCEGAIGDIRAGRFPPNESDFRCPRCPYLFICPSPTGASPA